MIERFYIAHLNGLILYDFAFDTSSSLRVDPFVSEWMIKTLIERTPFRHDQLLFHHLLDNKMDLVFVVVHQRVFTLPFNVEQLLEVVKLKFVEEFFGNRRIDPSELWTLNFGPFDPIFQKILSGMQSQSQRQAVIEKKPQHSQTKRVSKKNQKDENSAQLSPCASPPPPPSSETNVSSQDSPLTPSSDASPDAPDAAAPPKPLPLRGGAPPRRGGAPSHSRGGKKGASDAAPRQPVKKLREKGFGGGLTEYSHKDSLEFDRSRPSSSSPSASSADSSFRPLTAADFNLSKWDNDDDDDDDNDDGDKNKNNDADFVEGLVARSQEQKESASVAKKGFFSRYLGTLTNRTIDAADLRPVMLEFAQHLEAKNVASEVASELCQSVSQTLEGKNLPSFTRLESSVREALDQALLRILTPKRQIDILRDALEKKAAGVPYVVTFCGVNGVGKSTSLAKIAYWLKTNGLRVLIVACDTFRSAAIEQLEVHANRLGIDLHQQGYGKSPAAIAQNAIRNAKGKADVVLIDTAGRMQDNEPLMKCLCTLIQLNDPDLVLFVGEALVGNDGVDQLSKFNEALVRLSRASSVTERSIDGIVLTKFDTIDDKVGAALSMVYTIGAPILFLGTGQRYEDLKQMNPTAIVRSLIR